MLPDRSVSIQSGVRLYKAIFRTPIVSKAYSGTLVNIFIALINNSLEMGMPIVLFQV
jgi:hypothetical protein